MSIFTKECVQFITLLFATTVHAGESEGFHEASGRIDDVKYIAAEMKDSHDPTVDNVMGGMFGPLGDLVSGIFSTKQGAYYTYKILIEDDRVFEVSNRAKFNKNDCVKVIYPKLPGGYPESGINSNTKLEASTTCMWFQNNFWMNFSGVLVTEKGRPRNQSYELKVYRHE